MPPHHHAHTLDPDQISSTIRRLASRVEERFPGSGLSNQCQHLLLISMQAKARAEWIARPMRSLRLGALFLIVVMLATLLAVLLVLQKPATPLNIAQFVQLLESAINDSILIGATCFFLATLERRIKRGRALKALHELRAMAHIIDMHQLTKDPERMLARGKPTASSPERKMTAFELGRYLDYCSEMLSIIGKIAVLYIQDFDDDAALSTVNEIEALTTALSNKIWQKLVVLHSLE